MGRHSTGVNVVNLLFREGRPTMIHGVGYPKHRPGKGKHGVLVTLRNARKRRRK